MKMTRMTKMTIGSIAAASLLSLTACSAPVKEETHFENGASDINTGSYRIKDSKDKETYDVTITRYVDSIVPKNASRLAGDQSRFVAVKVKVTNKNSTAVNPQWVLDKVVLVEPGGKYYSPVQVSGEASDGPIAHTWTSLKPGEANTAYNIYEVGFNTQIEKVKIQIDKYPKAEWKVTKTTKN